MNRNGREGRKGTIEIPLPFCACPFNMTNAPPPREFQGRGLVPGVARGPALVSWDAISFLGDVDIRSGRIVGDLPSVKGACVAGTILIMPTSRGSAGAWRFIYQMEKHGTHPLALLFGGMPDPSVVQGAILAGIPVIANVPAELATIITSGDPLEVDGESGMVRCMKD